MPAEKPPYQYMPEPSEDEYRALKDSIRDVGVLVPIEVDEDGAILDGHTRMRAVFELRAEGLKVPEPDRKVLTGLSDDEKVAYVVTLNLDRRNLGPEQRQQLVADLREQGWSLRRIAEQVKASVGTVHADVAASGVQNRTPGTVRGKDRKSYRATSRRATSRPRPSGMTPPDEAERRRQERQEQVRAAVRHLLGILSANDGVTRAACEDERDLLIELRAAIGKVLPVQRRTKQKAP
jgi:hypothetical protein